MATVKITYNYRFGAKNRYYGNGTPKGPTDIGLEAFVIDHLNKSRNQIVLAMAHGQRQGESIVKAKSRVDTGAMRRQVTSTGSFGTDILKITFGWEEWRPFYAPFQEFGTRNGIKPMFAVKTAYDTVLASLQKQLGGR